MTIRITIDIYGFSQLGNIYHYFVRFHFVLSSSFTFLVDYVSLFFFQ